MKYIRHPVAAMLIFAILITLCVGIYDSLEDNYGVVPSDTRLVDGEEKDIMDQLKDINIIGGFDNLIQGIYTLVNPTGIVDILGGLATAGLGVLKISLGLITFPFEIMIVISAYYEIPPIVPIGLSLLIIIYLGFILVSAYMRGDV